MHLRLGLGESSLEVVDFAVIGIHVDFANVGAYVFVKRFHDQSELDDMRLSDWQTRDVHRGS